MTDVRIAYTEEMVGSGHPSKSDTLNRLAIVEHNNDGTHKWNLTNAIELDVREFLPVGFVTDGTLDYSAEFNNGIETIRDYALGKGGVLRVPLGKWNLGSGATGITLYEGISLVGVSRPEYVSSATAGGTWLIYTGTGDAIKIDGEWVGFDSRREIQIEKLGIKTTGSNSAINADFLTQFRFADVNIKGTGTYGIYSINSYNGILSRVKIDGPTNPFYLTIKASPNDVFSGQMLFEGCDFWNGTGGKGAHITASDNVLAQMVFLKCHFKTNAYGAYIEGGNVHKVNFLGCHFEANTTNDLYVHSDVTRGPVVKGCHFNNANAVYKIDCQGNTASIEDNEFVGSSTGYGIKINGEDNYIGRNYFYQNVTQKVILLDTGAVRTTIGSQVFSNASGRIVDNSTTASTTYEGEMTLVSQEFDLSAAASTEIKLLTNKDWWIREIKVQYTEATSADAGVALNIGNASSATAYGTVTTEISKSLYAITTVTPLSYYIPSGTTLLLACAGGKTGAGNAKVIIRMVPFANI